MTEGGIELHNEVEEGIDLNGKIVVFMGPEGSGKSTISKKLAEKSGKPVIAPGKIFRKIAKSGSNRRWSKTSRDTFSGGGYMEPEVVLEILTQKLKDPKLSEGFIIDGFMRSEEEVNGFSEMLEKNGLSMPVTIFYLRSPGWMGAERIAKDDSRPDRTDSSPNNTLNRLSHYYNGLGRRAKLIRGLIQEHDNWNFIPINATGDADRVFGEVKSTLNK
jgi:adenylate kinase